MRNTQGRRKLADWLLMRIAGLAILGMVSFVLVRATQMPSPPHLATSASLPLIAEPDPINLGILSPGQSARASIVLRNPGATPVILNHIETSCPCVRVTSEYLRVEPDQTVPLTVVFNPSEEPNYRGGLAVGYTGRSPDGVVVLRGRVDMEIVSPPSEATRALSRAESQEL